MVDPPSNVNLVKLGLFKRRSLLFWQQEEDFGLEKGRNGFRNICDNIMKNRSANIHRFATPREQIPILGMLGLSLKNERIFWIFLMPNFLTHMLVVSLKISDFFGCCGQKTLNTINKSSLFRFLSLNI